jgi:hypothetical protein
MLDRRIDSIPTWALQALGMLLVGVLAALLESRSGVNPDVAWFLEMATHTAEGNPLYLDARGSMLEVNPPLAIWMLMPAIWIVTRLGLEITAAPAILVGAEAAVAIVLSIAAVRRAPRAARRGIWLPAIAGLCLPAHDFAQREHQVVLLLAPYLIALAVTPDETSLPRPLRVAIGLTAGLGISLKPHFVGAWVLCEAVIAVLDREPRRLVRTETVAAAILLALYAASVFVITPAYLRLVEEWGPLYLRMNVRTLSTMLLRFESVVSFGALALAWPRRHRGLSGRIALVFGIVAGAFMLAVFVQGKGFDYHYFPALAFGAVSAGMTLSIASMRRERFAVRLPMVVLGGCLLLVTLTRIAIGFVLGDENRRLTAAYGRLAREQAVELQNGTGGLVVLSTRLPHAFPMATHLGLAWPLRVPSLWALETVTPIGCTKAAARDSAIERRFTDGIFADLAQSAPAVIVVAPLPSSMRPRSGCVTVVDHLSREPRFATMFARYVPIDTIPRDVYGPFLVLGRSMGKRRLETQAEATRQTSSP